MLYTDVDENGMIHRRLYTDNPEAAVPPGHRLLPDAGPRDLGATENFMVISPVEPVPIDAQQIEYRSVMLPEAVVAQRRRDLRNELLAESDWTQLLDAPLNPEQRQQWAAYRQALRDIPTQAGFPYEVSMPQTP